MAVEAVASMVTHKLTDMLAEESFTYDKVIVDQLKQIKTELEQRRGFLIDAEAKQEHDGVEEWARQYLHSLYNVEDVIENCALRVARRRKWLGFLLNHALFFNNLKAFRKLRWKRKELGSEIRRLNNQKPAAVEDASRKSRISCTSFTDEASQHAQRSISGDQNGVAADEDEDEETKSDTTENAETGFKKKSHASLIRERELPPKLTFSYSCDEEEFRIGSFKRDVSSLVTRLCRERNQVVSIVGELGSGKTTLARAIYRNRAIKDRFKCRHWVLVSKEENSNSDQLSSLLNPFKCLKDEEKKGFLVVMDDVRTCDQWDKIRYAFQVPADSAATIILTTCDQDVARYADPEPHTLNSLSKRDSWDMFCKKLGLVEEPNSPQNLIPDDLKGKILEICNGIPLNIILLGSLFSTFITPKRKRSAICDEWYTVINTEGNWKTSDILSLSYNRLPFHSKLCLLYLVLFPKEFDIPVRRLLRLWLAEGFGSRKQSGSDTLVPEDEVQKCFDDLVTRSMIQISKLRSDGSPRRCRLLGLIHDFLLPKARDDIGLFHVHRNNDASAVVGPFGVRRFIQYADMKNLSRDMKNWSCNPSELQLLRSYLSFDFQKKDTPAKEVGRFVSKIIGNGLGLLRVLDLEGVYKPSLPDNLGDLFHLRYLGLRWTFLDTLPPSVGDLPYLETMDVKHTNITSLPNSIWKLKHLRHLNLNVIRLDMPMRPPSRLLTLWGLFVDHKSPVKNGLDRLSDLRELSITFHLSSSQELVDWIAKLTALRSLRLRSKDDNGRPSKLSLKPLPNLKELTHLNLLGNLQALPQMQDFPPILKVLTLSVSELKEDPMPTLGQLPSLTVLRLLANSYLKEDMVCPEGGFSKLRVLKLWMLKKLKNWDVKPGAMQSLKELNIRCCKRLKNIPSQLLKLRTFEELILTTMPEEFIKDAKQRKSDHTYLTVNTWEFSSLPWEQDHSSQTEAED